MMALATSLKAALVALNSSMAVCLSLVAPVSADSSAVVLAAVSSAAACSSAEVSLPPQAARAKHRVRESKSNANFFMGKTSFHLFVNSVLGCAMGIGYPLSTKNGTLWHESHQKRPESTVLTETAAG